MISKLKKKNTNPKIAISALGLTISALELLEFDDLGTGAVRVWRSQHWSLDLLILAPKVCWSRLCFPIRFLCCVLWVGLWWNKGLKELESYRLKFHIELDYKRLDLLQWSRALNTWDTSFLNNLETLLTNEIVWGIVLICNYFP